MYMTDSMLLQLLWVSVHIYTCVWLWQRHCLFIVKEKQDSMISLKKKIGQTNTNKLFPK